MRRFCIALIVAATCLLGGYERRAVAQTKPAAAELSPEDAEKIATATAMLKKITNLPEKEFRAGYQKLVDLGEPVQVVLLADIVDKKLGNNRKIAILVKTWRDNGWTISDRNTAGAIALIPEIGKAMRTESSDILSLYGDIPETMAGYLPLITFYLPAVREPAVEHVMKLDPSGKAALEAVKKEMSRGKQNDDSKYYATLRRIGEPAVPYLIELSHRADLNSRVQAVRALTPLKPGTFNVAAAERITDLYLDGTSDLSASKYQLERWQRSIREEAQETLQAMGPDGESLLADLEAGKHPPNARRKKMMAETNVPAPVKVALFPGDPSASVSDEQYALIEELAALYNKGDERATVERAMTLIETSQDESNRLIGANLLGVLPGVGKLPEDEARLIKSARLPELPVRQAVCDVLLGGKFSYSPEIKSLCIFLLNKPFEEQNLTMAMFAKLPLGRRALIDGLTIETDDLYSASTRMLEAVIADHPEMAGLRGAASGKPWIDLKWRASVQQVLRAMEADPAQADRILIERLNDPDPTTAAVAATAMSDERSLSRLGPASTEKVLALSLQPPQQFGVPPLIGTPLNMISTAFLGPPVTLVQAYGPAVPDPELKLSNWTWLSTGSFAGAVLLGLAILLMLPTHRQATA